MEGVTQRSAGLIEVYPLPEATVRSADP